MEDFYGIGWGILSSLFIFISACSYMKAICTRTLKRPVVSTLTLWFIIGSIIFFASMEAGITFETTLLPICMGAVNPFIIMVLSFWYGDYTWNTIDSWCVAICVLAVLIWKTTNDPFLGMVGGLSADVIAAVPIVLKCWKEPHDEPLIPWALFVFGSALNIFAVKEWEIVHWIFPVYMTVFGMTALVPLLHHHFKKV